MSASATGTTGAAASTAAETGAETAEPTGAGASTGEATGATTGATTGSTTGSVDPSDGTSSGTTGEAPASCCSIPDVANAKVSGTTPHGPVDLTWAWYGIHGGECGGVSVFVFADPGQLAMMVGPWVEVFLPSFDVEMAEAPAFFTVADAQGKQEFVEGTATIGVIDEGHEPWWCGPGDPVVETASRAGVSFELVADGWDLSGTIEAVYCPQLSVICP